MMAFTYRNPGSPVTITLSPEKLARRIAVFCATNNITDDASLEAYINGLGTLTAVRNVMREFFVALIDIRPAP